MRTIKDFLNRLSKDDLYIYNSLNGIEFYNKINYKKRSIQEMISVHDGITINELLDKLKEKDPQYMENNWKFYLDDYENYLTYERKETDDEYNSRIKTEEDKLIKIINQCKNKYIELEIENKKLSETIHKLKEKMAKLCDI